MQSYDKFNCINISNVINKLGLRKTSQRGSNIYLACPFCQNNTDKKGYMKANIFNNCFICNKCEISGTSIDLYSKLKYISTRDAFLELIKERPILSNMPYNYNNPIKDEYYRDLVYKKFLDLLKLSEEHIKKLKSMNLNEDYLIKNNFKSIENNDTKKKEICKDLQNNGLRLDGIPGFYQDKDFKWTFKSHNGIFIPVVLNNKIQGLRIALDEVYSNDTENIWFSSNNEYNGTKATNWPIVLRGENISWADMYNSKNKNEILIATEIILAHKLHFMTDKVVLGIPNNIDKELLWNVISSMNVNEAVVYFDNYTLKHTAASTYTNTMIFLEEKGIKTNFRVAISRNIETDEFDEKGQIKVA